MIRVNSFVGHQWHIVVGNVRVASWTVSLDPRVNQDFIVSYKVGPVVFIFGVILGVFSAVCFLF